MLVRALEHSPCELASHSRVDGRDSEMNHSAFQRFRPCFGGAFCLSCQLLRTLQGRQDSAAQFLVLSLKKLKPNCTDTDFSPKQLSVLSEITLIERPVPVRFIWLRSLLVGMTGLVFFF